MRKLFLPHALLRRAIPDW